ncbi:FAD-dependent monooxygenase [Nocardia crassostreae]|uniref:FAD-dependent monooxygenase n=1 Tax=Nocardia crassostreae TaxID=53428 RepID=UPI001C3F9BC5|nr:FAD-dependent monooxygenase [Nocardia crassostreae]
MNDEVEVLIVGGGPVGLTARILLERWGVRVLLVEKHRELPPFRRSRLVNMRSMEIFRRLGIAAEITRRGFAPEFGRVRFRDTLQDGDYATAAMIGINAPIPESPEIGVVTSQDRLEPILLGAAEAPVRFGVELTELSEDAEGVAAVLTDLDDGVRSRVRARYVLAADGANSTVREQLGIGASGPGAIGRFTTVVFDAELHDWAAAQPAGLYMTTRGTFAPLYPEGGWAWFSRAPEDPASADWAALVSRALGPDIAAKPEVLRVQHWVMNAFVADRFTDGRILLAGDAAHAVPVFGGLGMNAGLSDVHNLCWKLAGVLHGWAAPGLLETYETERLPVAQQTLRQAVANAQLALRVQAERREHRRYDAAGEEIEPPWANQFSDQRGLLLGVTYSSAAVLPDGDSPAAAATKPGRRLPHRWLTAERSTLDELGEWFTLLTADPAHWEPGGGVRWPVRIEALPVVHATHWGLGARGALLVRPDDHIAARWLDPHAGDYTLRDALATLTGGPVSY